MGLNIVICTFNRMGLLPKALGSLNGAMRPSPYRVEILVVANTHTDQAAGVEPFRSA